MKWFFFVLALGTSFFCWTDDEIQWLRMKECGCVWQDQKLDKLWRSPRGGPFMMGVNPEYFVFCCRNRRKEAVCEVAAVWDRISKALCDRGALGEDPS